MANSAQARKRARQSETHRERNAAQRATLRTAIRRVRQALTTQNKEAAPEAFRTATATIDRSAARGLIHANTASRYKSRLNARVKALVAG